MRFVQSWACDNYIKLLTSDNAATQQRDNAIKILLTLKYEKLLLNQKELRHQT